jgi:hypothetical protein
MSLVDVVWVFDRWDPARDYPEQVGEIWCCGRHVIKRGATIVCEACNTAVEQVGGRWCVVRINSRSYRCSPVVSEVSG